MRIQNHRNYVKIVFFPLVLKLGTDFKKQDFQVFQYYLPHPLKT